MSPIFAPSPATGPGIETVGAPARVNTRAEPV